MNAIIFYRCCKYLNKPKTEAEKELADSNLFIRKARYAYWVLSVLELNKLYGKQHDDYTFKKLVEKLLLDYQKVPWSNRLSLELIYNWRDKLNDQKIIETIKKLHALRDNYYAHSDKNPKDDIQVLTPEYDQIESLIELGKDIIFEIKSNVFGVHQLLEVRGTENANNILNQLVEYHKLKTKEFEKKHLG